MIIFLRSVIELIIGIGLLFSGGELFVQGSITFAKILGVPHLIIGLTVVALGTSAPELFVSLSSLYQGSDALAVSNVIGSNIFNILVVLGSSAIIFPIKVESRLIKRDIPILLVASSAVWGMASAGKVTWQAGSSLLLALLINTLWEIRTVKKESKKKIEITTNDNNKQQTKYLEVIMAIIKTIAGITLLLIGSNLLVKGASSIAIILGISEVIVGLTIVSAGTSMPELVTSLVATIKGKTDLAIGNVIGSSLLNQLPVLSSCAIYSAPEGLQVEKILIQKDMPIMVLSTLACMPIFWTKGKISRIEGIGLLGLYSLYLTDKILTESFNSIHNQFKLITLFFILPIGFILITFKVIKHYHQREIQNNY